MLLKGRVQAASIALNNGLSAAKRNYNVVLDADFKRVKGFYLIRNNGTDYLKIGIKDAKGVSILEPVNSKHIEVSTNPKIADRFFTETPFEANGKTIVISVENFAALSTAHDFDVLFLLDNEN